MEFYLTSALRSGIVIFPKHFQQVGIRIFGWIVNNLGSLSVISAI